MNWWLLIYCGQFIVGLVMSVLFGIRMHEQAECRLWNTLWMLYCLALAIGGLYNLIIGRWIR